MCYDGGWSELINPIGRYMTILVNFIQESKTKVNYIRSVKKLDAFL